MNFNEIRDELENGVEEVGNVAREIVAKRVAIIAVITVLLNLAVGYGWFGIDASNDVLKWIGAAFDAAAAVSAVLVVRPSVTPVKDPRNNAGDKLVPVSDVLAAVEKAQSQAYQELQELKAGNVENAADALKNVVDAGKQVVEAVKTDAAAVVEPIKEAAEPGDSPAKNPNATL